MNRTEFKAYAVREMGNTYSNALPAKGAITELAGRVFDAVNPLWTLKTDNYTLTEDDSGGVFGIATAAKAFTLPPTKAGLEYTIVNFGATTNNIVTITPNAADGISGTFTLAATTVVDAGVVGKKIINTAATSQCGDNVRLYGTGVTGTKAWIILSSTGIWAVEG